VAIKRNLSYFELICKTSSLAHACNVKSWRRLLAQQLAKQS